MRSSALAAGIRRLRGRLALQQRQEDSDEQLLHAFANRRDEIAFTALVRRLGAMVLHVCRRVLGHEQDAEDAYQATFLVLARHAASVRNKSALASFLHGTAYRIAMKAKQSAARRRKHEDRVPPRPQANPSDDLLWREVRTLLDEEIALLPEIYRSVFVLCCLENLSQAEAGRRLALKERTVSNRLAEARKRLQFRLSRRGVELSALLAATALTTETALALPPVLLAITSESTVAPAIAALADSGPMILSLGKAKLSIIVLLMTSVLTGAGLWACLGLAVPNAVAPAQSPATKASAKPRTVPPQRDTANSVEIKGRVLGPDGKPKAGVKLLLPSTHDPDEQQELFLESGKVRQLGVSAVDGRFTIAVPKERKQHYLIAQSGDTGIDFLDVASLKPGKLVELRLVKDHVISGRVVNTEGKPVRGVRVAVNHLGVYPNNSLDSFLVFWKNRPFNIGERGSEKDIWSGASALLAATTAADGRFALHGVGEERLVSLRLSGGGIAADEVWVANRAGFDPKPYNQATLDNLPKGERGFNGRWMLSGPDVSVVAEAEKIIRGVVTEADTGKKRPGVLVKLTRKNGDDHKGGENVALTLQTKTDAEGRYEIHGAHKAKSYLVEVRSDAATGYLGRCGWAEDTPGFRPVIADIRVRKGVIVTGKMIDKTTGKPIEGFVEIGNLFDNPFVKEYSDDSFLTLFNWTTTDYRTDANGVFRAVTLPGPVLLMGGTGSTLCEYKNSIPDTKYPQYFEKLSDHVYRYRSSSNTYVDGNFCKVLQIKRDAAVVKQDIVLERRNVLGVVKIQDAEGKSLPGANVWGPPNRIEGDSCTVYGETTVKLRFLVFYEPKRKLAGTLKMKAGEKLPPVVKLKPMGSVTARLLDADGQPLAGIVVAPRYRESMANGINGRLHESRPIASDASGAFTLDSLISELQFELSFRRGRRDFEQTTKPADMVIQVKPGECRDVGAIKLKLVPEKVGE